VYIILWDNQTVSQPHHKEMRAACAQVETVSHCRVSGYNLIDAETQLTSHCETTKYGDRSYIIYNASQKSHIYKTGLKGLPKTWTKVD
jgi:hypothetical protein